MGKWRADIDRARKARGWSLAQLADEAGIARTTVSEIMAGTRANPQQRTLRRIEAVALTQMPGAETTDRDDSDSSDSPIRVVFNLPPDAVAGLGEAARQEAEAEAMVVLLRALRRIRHEGGSGLPHDPVGGSSSEIDSGRS